MNDQLLMLPGPTILPAEVREALAQPSIFHRGADFAAILDECTRGLQYLLGTTQPALILASSGTGAVESIIVSTLSPGDRVLAINGGKFGERIGLIAAAFGADVTWLQVEPGQAANPDEVRTLLRQQDFRALLFVLNETSTGVRQPAAELALAAHETDTLVLMDAVSALAGMPVELDQWGLAGVGAGSQKAVMLPPGLAFAALGPKGIEALETARMPRFYFDLGKALKSLAKGQTPYTPSVNLIVALQAALRLIEAEGLEAVFARHRQLAAACRAAARAAGLTLLADESCASEVVTAMNSPQGLDSSLLVKALRERHNIIISGGQDSLKGKIFRIGHLGACRLEDLLRTWEATAVELTELGHPCSAADCLTAAQEAYQS